MERRKFRICAKGWFLTYPRCDLSKEQVLEAIKAKRPGLKQIVVARELHEDGYPHLHAYLYYDPKFDCTNERFFDIDAYHPNVQAAKSLRAVSRYIKKDGDYIQEGINYKAELEAIQDHKAVLGKRLIDGESLELLAEEFPQIIFGFKKLYEDVRFFRSVKTPSLPRCSGFIPNSFGLIMPLLSDKRRHYWLWSKTPNKGKTTWLKSLQAHFPCLWYTWVEKFQTHSPHAQFVLIDEYSTGHLTVTQLNMMCDSTYQYPVKGTDSFSLFDSVILICGNKDPFKIYEESHHPLLRARFQVFQLDKLN